MISDEQVERVASRPRLRPLGEGGEGVSRFWSAFGFGFLAYMVARDAGVPAWNGWWPIGDAFDIASTTAASVWCLIRALEKRP